MTSLLITSQPRPLLSVSNCLRKSGWLEEMGARPVAATSEQFAKRVLSRSGHLFSSGSGITRLILRIVRNGCVLISSSRGEADSVAEAEADAHAKG